MGTECGQGGLRIDREPLQRCAHWDPEEEMWGVDTSGPLMLSALLYRWEVLLYVNEETLNTEVKQCSFVKSQ